MDVAVVGAGRVATALAVRWRSAGHRIVAVSGRAATPARAGSHLPGVAVLRAAEAARRGELVVLGTPDDAIAPTCRALVEAGSVTTGRIVAHLSGATSLDVLAPAEEVGATVLSLHPLQTFPDVGSAVDRLVGCPIAVTARAEGGLELGRRLALDAGGRPFALDDEAKPLYHAAAVFASNYLVAVSALAEQVGRAAGLDEPLVLLAPLQATTLANVDAMAPGGALTGPAVRGDAGTIERHLDELDRSVPSAVAPYVALARVALDVGERAGRLDPQSRAAVEDVLSRWS